MINPECVPGTHETSERKREYHTHKTIPKESDALKKKKTITKK